ncbi:MAG TPA: hypothetical protein VNX46_07460, partial [Candidatus Acidoferrum sp.]|nr:hypothetical protein [Candidatus Acidoferrum sp.]
MPSHTTGTGREPAYWLTMMVPKRRYLSYLRERWWVVLACLVFTQSVNLVHEAIRTPQFTSYSQIYVVNGPRLDGGDIFSDAAETYIGTQIELLNSGPIIGGAMQKVGIQVPLGEKNPYQVDVEQTPKTSVLMLQAMGPDPDVTQHYLRALVEGDLNYDKETHISTSQDVLDSLRDQLSAKAADLQAEEDKLTAFEQSNNVAVIQQESKSAGGYLAGLNLQLAQDKLQAKLLSDQIEAETPAPAQAAVTNVTATVVQNTSQAATNGIPAGALASGVVLANATDPAAVGAPAPMAPNVSLPPNTNVADADTDSVLNTRRDQLAELLANKEDNLRHMGLHGFNEQVSRLQQTIAILQDQDRSEKIAWLTALQKRIAAVQSSLPANEARLHEDLDRLTRAETLKKNVERVQGYYDHLLHTLQSVDLKKDVQQEGLSVLQP